MSPEAFAGAQNLTLESHLEVHVKPVRALLFVAQTCCSLTNVRRKHQLRVCKRLFF